MGKNNYGINGIHSEIGNAINEAEFRGKVITQMDFHEKQTKEIKEEIKRLEKLILESVANRNQKLEKVNNRLDDLEKWKTNQAGFIAGISAAVGIIIAIFIQIISFFK